MVSLQYNNNYHTKQTTMELITLTKKRVDQILPDNIKNSDVMSNNAKKTLAAILNYFVSMDKAKENGYVYLSNETIRKTIKIGKSQMLNAIQELCEFNLIKRERGEVWTKGKQKTASKYFVYTKKLYEPLVKPCASDILACIPDASSPTVTVTVKDTVKVKVSDTVIDTVLVKEKDKKNILNNILYNDNNKINIIDNITVCGDEPQATESITNDKNNLTMTEEKNNQTFDEPAYANTDLNSIFKEMNSCSSISRLVRLYNNASKLINEDDTKGRLTLLQLTHNIMEKNHITTGSPEDYAMLEEDGKMAKLRDLFDGRPSGITVVRMLTKINPTGYQIILTLPHLKNRIISEEDGREWRNSKAMVTTSADTSVLRLF